MALGRSVYSTTEVITISRGLTAIGATEMQTPDGKQRHPTIDLSEAALWYLRSKAKRLPTEELQEFASWLRRSPENASALLSLATRAHGRNPRPRSTNRFKQALARVLRMDGADKSASAEHRALSLSYLNHVKQKHLLPKMGLLAVALFGVAAWMFLHDARLLKIAAASLACLLLLMIREAVIRFRVTNGYFASTESEVRDFVKFISSHRGDIDFTDRGGKRRQSLVPEPQQSKSVSAPAATGVLPE